MNASELFNRGLKDEFVEALNREYEKDGSWWKKIVDDPKLFIGIRENYLNVYFNGASLLELEQNAGHLVGKTYCKYLLKRGRYAKFKNGSLDPLNSAEFYCNIEVDIADIKKAAARIQGAEKKGVHQIMIDNANVIDTEIAFPGLLNRKQIDFVALRKEKNGPKLVFYEAKTFSSSKLRKKPPKVPEVIEQIKGYDEILSVREKEIKESYRRVATNIAALSGYATRRNVLQEAKEGSFDVCPEVRLVIFGFDGVQKEAANSSDGLFTRLKGILGENRVLTKDDPRKFVVGISK